MWTGKYVYNVVLNFVMIVMLTIMILLISTLLPPLALDLRKRSVLGVIAYGPIATIKDENNENEASDFHIG